MANGREIAAAYLALVPSARGIKSNLESELRGPARQAGQTAGQEIEEGITAGTQSAGRKAAGLLASTLGSAAILSGLNRAKDAASELQQAVGGTQAVFADAAGTIDDFAEGSAEAVGLSARAAREFTSQIGAALQGYGYSVDEAASKSIELTTLGADLAATFGGTVPEAVTALSAALRGEFDPLERYGVALRASDIAARAVKDGLAESESSVSNYAKAQSALAIIMEQTAGAQGQFARESDTAAGQAAISAAKVEDSAASLGEALLPIYAKIAETVGTIADAFASLPDPVQTGIVALAGVAAVAGPVSRTVDLFRTLRPTAATAAAGMAQASSAARNSAASFDNLYTGSSRASRALGGMAKAGAALAAVGLAYELYQIGQASRGVAVDIEWATRSTTEELVENFQQLANLNWGDSAEEAFRQLAEGGEAGYAAAIELRDGLKAAGEETSVYDDILNEVAEGQALANERATAGADALNEVAGGADNAADALGDVAVEGLEASDILDALNDQLDDGIDLFRDYFGAISSDEESMIRFRDVLRDMAGMQEDVNEGQLKGQERVDAFAESILKGRDVILDMAESWARSGVPLEEITARMSDLADELLDGADQAGLTKKEVAELREEFGLMPEQISVAVETNLRQVYEDQKAWNEAIAEALRIQEVMWPFKSVTTGDRRVRAKGGPVAQGEVALVGEEGPELVRFDRAGFVTPNDIFEGLAPSSAGAGQVHLHVTQLPGEDQVDAGLRALRHHQRVQLEVAAR